MLGSFLVEMNRKFNIKMELYWTSSSDLWKDERFWNALMETMHVEVFLDEELIISYTLLLDENNNIIGHVLQTDDEDMLKDFHEVKSKIESHLVGNVL